VSSDEHYFGHGRVAYLQIPSVDLQASAQFYVDAFGWTSRASSRPDHLSFTDATGDMIGSWDTRLAISTEAGVLPYIYVRGFDAALERLRAAGAEIVREPYLEGDVWVATFRDPAGNVLGIFQRDPR
jgi:predicted enzyme related to lactoylglutathione lyase